MVEYTMSPRLLRIAGPAIEVSVNGRIGVALLDTGASVSSLDLTYAQARDLPVAGTHQSAGATGTGEHPVFDEDILIPVLDMTPPPDRRAPPESAWSSLGRNHRARRPLPV